jgi:hypothetical protein
MPKVDLCNLYSQATFLFLSFLRYLALCIFLPMTPCSSGCRGWCRLRTFNGICYLNNLFNRSALRSFYVQTDILRILYSDTISLICTVFKLSCPAHLFPNTPRTIVSQIGWICQKKAFLGTGYCL